MFQFWFSIWYLPMSVPEKETTSEKPYHCPACKKPMRRIEGKKGLFWGCTGYPECETTLHDDNGKPLAQSDERYRCPICTRRLVKADPDKGNYWFCSGYSKGCRATLADNNGIPEEAHHCPSCRNLLMKREGKNGVFWGCRSYPNCKTSFKDLDNRPDFDLFTTKSS